MSNSPADAVLAGTKTFAVALLAPLTTRVGVRPRIAADAAQAAALSGPGALVVIEYAGAEALAGIERLVKDGSRRVVAGVPAAHAGDEPALRALGVEIARWDGRPDGVLEAVSRRIGAPLNAAAPVAPAPPKPVAAPAAKPAPAAAAARPPAPAAPGVKPATPAPVAKPAAAPAAAARPAPAPGAKPSPVSAPVAKPAAPPRTAPAPAPAAAKPAPAPAPTAPVAARPAVPPVASTPARPAVAAPVAAPAKPAVAAPAAPEPLVPAKAAAVPAPTFFDDIGEDGVDVDPIDLDVSDAFELVAPASAVPAQTPAEPAGDWPATLPDEPAAAEALVLAIAGRAQGPYAAVAVQLLDALSGVEKAVLSGEEQSFDATALRRAATMRLRVAQALATVPPAGSRVDQAAVNALLGEIDALLSAVATLATSLPPEVQPVVEAVRHGLVAEAIDFSEAVQKLQPAEGGAAPAAVPPPTAAARRAAQTRVISVGSGEAEVAEARRGRLLWILLAVALLATGGYHGFQYWNRQQAIAARPTLPDAPANMVLVPGPPGSPQLLVPAPGKRPDRAEVERFKQAQQLRGFEVRELKSGALEISPASKGATR